MKFDETTLKKVAHLARLEISEADQKRYSTQIQSILTYIDKLNELDTSKIEPLNHALEPEMQLRADEVEPGPGVEKMMENAPEPLYENFKVPQVMGGE